MRLARSALLAGVLVLAAGAAHAADNVQAATDAYLASVPLAARLKSDAYFEGGYWLILWDALYGIGIAVLLLASGVSARMRDVAFRLAGGRRWPGIALYAVLFTLVTALLQLPLDIYQGFLREHAYNLSNQSFAAWLGDDLIQLGVSAVAAAIVLPPVYMAIRRAPRFWWAWGTGIVMVGLTFGVVIGPVFLEPLTNSFKPLAAGPVRDQILAMAHADGVPASGVREYDSSRQSDRISAHVSGMFGTTQISVTDNLIAQCTPDEILAVMGHEIGHYVMGHVLGVLAGLLLVMAGGFAFARWCLTRALARYGPVWRVHGPDDPAGLPVLVAAFTLYFLVMTPVQNSLTRRQEMQADIFGLNLARRPDAFATVALKLGKYRKLDPSPWEEMVFFDHPSGRTRIYTAMRWKAEHLQ